MLFLPDMFLSEVCLGAAGSCLGRGRRRGGGGGRTVNYDETQPKSQGSVVAEEELEPGMGV